MENVQFKITVPDNSIRTKIGQGEINSFIQEYNFGEDNVDPSGAFTVSGVSSAGASQQTITVTHGTSGNVMQYQQFFSIIKGT